MLAHLGLSDDPDTLDAADGVIARVLTGLADPYCGVAGNDQMLLVHIQGQGPGHGVPSNHFHNETCVSPVLG